MTQDDHEKNEAKLLEVLNKLAQINPKIYDACSLPIVFGDELAELEEKYEDIVLMQKDGQWVMTVPALIATMTEILCGKKISFVVDEETGETKGFAWV